MTEEFFGHQRPMSNDAHNTEPATTKGTTAPAGVGESDREFAADVASQTDPNLKAEDVFERESEGTVDDAAAADTSGDALR